MKDIYVQLANDILGDIVVDAAKEKSEIYKTMPQEITARFLKALREVDKLQNETRKDFGRLEAQVIVASALFGKLTGDEDISAESMAGYLISMYCQTHIALDNYDTVVSKLHDADLVFASGSSADECLLLLESAKKGDLL